MRPRAAVLVAAALLGAALPAQALTYNVTAHDDGSRYWFEVEGLGGRNPELRLPPGTTVTFHVRNEGRVAHDLHFDPPVSRASPLLPPGGQATFTADIPADFDEAPYYCHPHASLGMAGTASADGRKGAPLPPLGAALAALALAAAAARWRR